MLHPVLGERQDSPWAVLFSAWLQSLGLKDPAHNSPSFHELDGGARNDEPMEQLFRMVLASFGLSHIPD